MDEVSPLPPVLTVHRDYLLPVTAREFGVCGEQNLEAGCYDGCRFIDSTGKEWSIRKVRTLGYSSAIHRFLPRAYRKVRVSFDLVYAREYSLGDLKSLVGEFLLNNKLVGSPFADKGKEVPSYLERFDSVRHLIAEVGYFDARRQ